MPERPECGSKRLTEILRAPADDGFIRSIYFRDPNGYVIEPTARTESAEAYAREAERRAHDRLAHWQRGEPAAR